MHALIAAFFAAIFSFCHASATQHALDKPPVFADNQPAFTEAEYVPTRRDLTRAAPVYPEGGCVSCGMTNVVYNVR